MVAVVFADGFEEIEGVTVYDILKRAGIETVLAGVGSKKITGAHGLKITTDIEAGELDATLIEMLVLPGGMPGTRNLGNSRKIKELITALNKAGKRIAAICAAPSILGEMGLLENLEAICYPGYESKLTGAVISRKETVTDGIITTSRGPGTAFSFALEIVRLLRGEDKAEELAKTMQYTHR